MHPIVLAMTGASGSAYGFRLLEILLDAGQAVHLTISPAAAQVSLRELGIQIDLDRFDLASLAPAWRPPAQGASPDPTHPSFSWRAAVGGQLTYHHYQDFSAGIASGSFLTAGMVICPCSMGTLASLATGQSSNLIHRAADVHLKERRKLIVVPRETPLGSIQLQNMKTLADAGAVVLPAMPGFYHQPATIFDLVDFVVGRICDQLGLQIDLVRRWGPPEPGGRRE